MDAKITASKEASVPFSFSEDEIMCHLCFPVGCVPAHEPFMVKLALAEHKHLGVHLLRLR
jgi:hypothetical protein